VAAFRTPRHPRQFIFSAAFPTMACQRHVWILGENCMLSQMLDRSRGAPTLDFGPWTLDLRKKPLAPKTREGLEGTPYDNRLEFIG
jgi:hypothetical protein